MNSSQRKLMEVELIFLLLEGLPFHTTACNIFCRAFPFQTHAPIKMQTNLRTIQF